MKHLVAYSLLGMLVTFLCLALSITSTANGVLVSQAAELQTDLEETQLLWLDASDTVTYNEVAHERELSNLGVMHQAEIAGINAAHQREISDLVIQCDKAIEASTSDVLARLLAKAQAEYTEAQAARRGNISEESNENVARSAANLRVALAFIK